MDSPHTRISALTRRFKQLQEQRRTWEDAYYKDITDFLFPERGRFADRADAPNQAKNRRSKIFDSTAQRAARILVAGMQSGMCSPSKPWFRLGLQGDPALEKYAPAREWLHGVEKTLYGVFSQTNLYSAITTVYKELVGYGTAVLFQEESFREHFYFLPLTCGQYWLVGDKFGRVNGLFRTFHLTAENAAALFGKDKVSGRVAENAEKHPDQYVEICHAILPRQDRNPGQIDNLHMPFASVYWERGGNSARPDQPLRVSGYEEFPAHCPRAETIGSDVYGQSLAFDALADIKQLQQQSKGLTMAIHKTLDPPLVAPSSFKGRISQIPGALNLGDDIADPGKGIRPLYQVNFNIRDASYHLESQRALVREGFFNDMFLMMLQRNGMTATEVAQRHEEKLLMLGPMIERQIHELYDPLIARSFHILARKGIIPPPPAELEGKAVKVEYISILAQAQKMAGVGGIERFTGFLGGVAQLNPQALDKLNIDRTVDEYGAMMGVPPGILHSGDQVAHIRQARYLAQQQQNQAAPAPKEA